MKDEYGKNENIVKRFSQDASLLGKYISVVNYTKPFLENEPPINSKEFYYTSHGVAHSKKLLQYLGVFSKTNSLLNYQAFLLACAAWFHDLGMYTPEDKSDPIKIRKQHQDRSAKEVESFFKQSKNTGFTVQEIQVIKNLCKAHRSTFPIMRLNNNLSLGEGDNKFVNEQQLAAFLRIADACDSTRLRCSAAIMDRYGKDIPTESKPHWEKIQHIHDIALEDNCSIIAVYVDGNKKSKDDFKWVEQNLWREIDSVARIRSERCHLPRAVLILDTKNNNKRIDL